MIVPHALPGGGRIMIDSDVLDIGNRLQQGDPTCDWPGDPNLSLHWNEITSRFEVWHISLDGKPYLVCSAQRCDAMLLHQVIDRDNHYHDVIGELDAHNAKVAAEKQKRFADWQGEFADKFRWAIKKDLAQHLGGRL